jgi:hypothetical protein
MNLQRFKLFLEFLFNKQNILYRFRPSSTHWLVGPRLGQLPPRHRPNQPVLTGAWPHRRWVADDGGDARELPRTSEQAKKIRENSGNPLVAAPPEEGHRSDAGDLDRGGALRPTAKLELQTKLRCNKMSGRSASSPRIFWNGLRRRLSMETSSVLPIPASICEGERWFAGDWSYPFSIPSLEMK